MRALGSSNWPKLEKAARCARLKTGLHNGRAITDGGPHWRRQGCLNVFMHKEFNIDWDSLEQVTRLFSQAKSRYFELKRIATQTPSRKERQRRIFDACRTIWEADISALYDAETNSSPDYYVYAHLDTSKRIAAGAKGITTFAATLGMQHWPFYVGKGCGNRRFELQRNETHRKVRQRLTRLGMEPTVICLKDGLSCAQALQYEAKLIDIFGLVTNGGLLCNLDEGTSPYARRQLYCAAYQALTRINIPLSSTHVEGLAATDKTRVVPATSTMRRHAAAL